MSPLGSADAQTTNSELIEAAASKTEAELLAAISSATAPMYDTTALGLRGLKAAEVITDPIVIAVVQKMAKPIENQDLINLHVVGVASSEIVSLLRGATPETAAKLDASVTGLAQLRAAEVPEVVVQAVARRVAPPLTSSDEDLALLEALAIRFTGGSILANGSLEVVPGSIDPETMAVSDASLRTSQFAQASAYLAFESQPMKTFGRMSTSGILNVRLTSIPVSGLASVTAPGNEFLSSQKAVQVQFGGLLDFHFGEFSAGSGEFRWALGPVGRYSLQSITDSQRGARIWNLEDDLYEAGTAGVRLTLYQRRAVRAAEHWRSAAYLEFTYGTFENYETATPSQVGSEADQVRAAGCLSRPVSCFEDPPLKTIFDTHSETRFYVEARLILKYLYLGLDINSGSGRDDVRFIAGLTVSLDQFFQP